MTKSWRAGGMGVDVAGLTAMAPAALPQAMTKPMTVTIRQAGGVRGGPVPPGVAVVGLTQMVPMPTASMEPMPTVLPTLTASMAPMPKASVAVVLLMLVPLLLVAVVLVPTAAAAAIAPSTVAVQATVAYVLTVLVTELPEESTGHVSSALRPRFSPGSSSRPFSSRSSELSLG